MLCIAKEQNHCWLGCISFNQVGKEYKICYFIKYSCTLSHMKGHDVKNIFHLVNFTKISQKCSKKCEKGM